MIILRFFKRHLLATIIIGSALLLAGTTLFIVIWQSNASIAKTKADSAAQSAKMDKLIADIKKKKADEKAAAEAKAKADAEAKAKADAQAQAQANAQRATSQAFAGTCNPSPTHRNPAALDIIVNKKHCIQPLGFTPGDLVTVYGATISAQAATDFTAMYQAAQAAGVPFNVSSSFRSYDTQVATYNYWVSVDGQAGADTVSARPGYSEHQTGLSVDLGAGGCTLDCFLNTPQYAWIQAHAAEFGFIQRYPPGLTGITGYSSEAWHYRYVGRAVAEDMKAKGISTLEQYWGIPGGDY